MSAAGSSGRRLFLASSRLLSNLASSTGPKLFPTLSTVSAAAVSASTSRTTASTSVLAPVPNWDGKSAYRIQNVQNFYRSFKYRFGLENPQKKRSRKRIVYLGTGWGAMRFINQLNTSKYELFIVSPRNFFVFTPLLPSVCSGALDPRSCMEPIRRFTIRGGKKLIEYYEGKAEDVNFEKNLVEVKSATGAKYNIDYDYLIVGVGSEANTFGIPGVKENAYFLKEAENAQEIRRKIISNFEHASLPGVTEEDQKRLLHFVCVGGGPSGVEVAAELADFVKEDVVKYYPTLLNKIRVSVIEMLPRVLPSFNLEVSEFTLKNFEKMNVDSYLRTRVTKVEHDAIHVVHHDGKSEALPCGFVLWASGIGQVPLSKKIMEKVPAQRQNRPPVMQVDQHLLLKGTPQKNVFAIGDCSYLVPMQLADHAAEIYEAAKASPEGVGMDFLKKSKELKYRFPQLNSEKCVCYEECEKDLSKQQFTDLLKKIDAGYRPPVPTAQNAGQEGRWLSCVLNDFDPVHDAQQLPAFVDANKGSLAYVGAGESVAQTPWFTLAGGVHSTLFWRAVYWSMQMSGHNKAMLLVDWLRLVLCGRDLVCGRTADLTENNTRVDGRGKKPDEAPKPDDKKSA